MDTDVTRQILRVVQEERESRARLLDEASPDYAYDRWQFVDEPFINEMCLLLLVAVRHGLERALPRLAARATGGQEIGRAEYLERVVQLKNAGMSRIVATLGLENFPEWATSLKALQLLANCYKHDQPWSPDKALLTHLNPHLPQGSDVNYAPLAESSALREAVALYLGLATDADYCEIAERFLTIVEQFLSSVEAQSAIGRVRREPVSLNPKHFLH